MDDLEMRRRAGDARVARVGTIDEHGRVHIVPIVFVLDRETLYSSTDAGPRPAKRLRNLERDPRVSILIDDYDEDWTRVWWIRMRGTGRAVEGGSEYDLAYRMLNEKYPQYRRDPAVGPVMAVDIEEWTGWANTD